MIYRYTNRVCAICTILDEITIRFHQGHFMIQQHFINNALDAIRKDNSIVGLTVGGSWLSREIDEYSDLDLVLVTHEKVSGNPARMLAYASSFGNLLSGFTGEHVGEPRLLICLYDDPLLHVDIKFLTPGELEHRVEDPMILYDTDGRLKNILASSVASYPLPDQQWIEDRFWIWIHYAATKIGRGEWMEAFDFLGFLRMMALGPLLQVKNGSLPRGVRKVEMSLPAADLLALQQTIAGYDRSSIIHALEGCIALYRDLRDQLHSNEINRQVQTELKAVAYFRSIQNR